MKAIHLKPLIKPGIPTLILILTILLAIWIAHLLLLPVFQESADDEYGKMNWPLVYHIPALVALTAINSLLIRRFVLRFSIIRIKSFLPVLIFLVFITVWSGVRFDLYPHLFLTAFIIGTEFFLGMFHNRKAVEHAFLTSFIVSLLSLLEPMYVVLFPLFWIGYIILKSMSLRVWLASLTGLAVPWVFFNAYYWFRGTTTVVAPDLTLLLKPSLYIPSSMWPLFIYGGLTGIITLIAIAGIFTKIFDDSVQTRKYIYILVFLMVAITILCVLYQPFAHLFLPLLAFLGSVLLAHPFTLHKSEFFPLLFIFLIIINIAYLFTQYFNLFSTWAI